MVDGMSISTVAVAAAPRRRARGSLGQILGCFPSSRSSALLFGRVMRRIVVASMLVASLPNLGRARVLNETDFEKISEIKTSFTRVATDISQSLRRSDISSGERDCINATLRQLLQISEELSSYEYLITIESQINDFDDDDTMKSILRFALERAISILEIERKRLNQLSEQCSRYPLSVGKTQQAVQFIDATAGILKSIQPRL
jgi:hypothetical protein